MNTPRLRSMRVFGRGALRKGARGWLLERATAIALVPLTVWFVAALIAHTGSDHAALIAWLRSPLNALLMTLLLIVMFWHTALGLGVVIKDYVHAIHQQTLALIAMRAVCLICAAAGIVAVAHIAFQVV
ncbi:MAG: succinate dehydrogenase, hydrophobic membrane anchor protein [Lysobacteraceae bacterium]